MKIIGIHGKKRTGKDTLAAYLIKCSPVSVLAKRVAFADPLKKELADACGVSVDFLEEHKDNFRMLLQGWGTDFRRNLFGNDYWITKMNVNLLELNAQGHNLFIIPDVRFLNEYDFIKKLGGIVIKIERNHTGIPDNHESERTIEAKFDYCISNNGDISHLEFVANNIINKHICPQ